MAARVRVPNSYTWALFVLFLQYGNWSIALAKATTSTNPPITTAATTRFPWNGRGATSAPTFTWTDPWTLRGGSQEDSSKGGSTSNAESSTTLDSIGDADLDKYIDFLLASVKDEIDENQNPLLALVRQTHDKELSEIVEDSELVDPSRTSLDKLLIEPQDTDEVDSSLANATMDALPEIVEETAVVQEEEVIVSIPEVESEASAAVEEDSATLSHTFEEEPMPDQQTDIEIVSSGANVTTDEEGVMSSTDSIQVQPVPVDAKTETSVLSDDLVNMDWINSALETPPPEDSETMSVSATGNTKMVCEGTVCRLVPDMDTDADAVTTGGDDVPVSPPLDAEEEIPLEQTPVEDESLSEESSLVADGFAQGAQQDATSATQEMETVVAKEEVIEETIAVQVDDIHISASTQQDRQLLANATLNTTETDLLIQNQTEAAEQDIAVPQVSFWGGIRRSWGLMTASALGIPTGNLTLNPPNQTNDTISVDSNRDIQGNTSSGCETVEQRATEADVETNESTIAEVETEHAVVLDDHPIENNETLLESPIEAGTIVNDEPCEPNEDTELLEDYEFESIEESSMSEDEFLEESGEMADIAPSTNSFVYRFLLSRGLYRLAMFLVLCDEWTREFVVPCVDPAPLNRCLELEALASKLSYLDFRGGASASPVVPAAPKVAPASKSILEASVQNNTENSEPSPAATTEKVRPNLVYRYLLGFEPYGHVAVMESVLLHEWTRVYIPMLESAISTLYRRFFPDATRRDDFDDFGDSQMSGFVSADGKAARGGKKRRELAKKADQNSLYQLQSLGDLSVARFRLVSKSFLERHGLGGGQLSEEVIPIKSSNTKSTRASSSSRSSPKPKAGIEITFGMKTPSSDDVPARRTRRKRREKEPDSIMTRIRSATEGNFVRSSILGAYPGDARRVSDAASSSGLYDLAKKYGYEDSDTEKSGALGSNGSSRRKSSSQRRKSQASADPHTTRRKRTKSSLADLDDWDKPLASTGAKRLESSLPSSPKQRDTSVLGKTSSVLKAGRIEVEKRSKDHKK